MFSQLDRPHMTDWKESDDKNISLLTVKLFGTILGYILGFLFAMFVMFSIIECSRRFVVAYTEVKTVKKQLKKDEYLQAMSKGMSAGTGNILSMGKGLGAAAKSEFRAGAGAASAAPVAEVEARQVSSV